MNDLMRPEIEESIVSELYCILAAWMRGEDHGASTLHHFTADFDHLEEFVGSRLAVLVLRKSGFYPTDYARGGWERDAKGPDQSALHLVDFDALAPSMRRAIKYLTPSKAA